jgi:hypothetical protein
VRESRNANAEEIPMGFVFDRPADATRWKRPLRALLLVLIALEGAYLVGTNVFLNTRLAPRAINRRPQQFEIRWQSAWSLWPGTVFLHDVETRGRSRSLDWYAHLDSVTATFRLAPLLNRIVHLNDVRAKGVDYRQRRILPPGAEPRFPVADLPRMPDLFQAAVSSALHPPAGPHGPSWTIVADRIRCDLDELWLDRFRLAGTMHLETPMALVVRGPMEFSHVHFTMPKGDLLVGDEKVFADVTIDADAWIHPFVPRQSKRLGFFRSLSGRFDLRSPSASVFFLDAYFRTTPWVHFNDRAAARVTFVLDHGRLQPGSSLDIVNPHADMRLIDRRIIGQGVIHGFVELVDGAPQSTVMATLHDFQVVPLDSDVPIARGDEATLRAISRTPDFSNPFPDVRMVFDLPEGHLLDVSCYNRMIPAASDFRFVSGTGTLRYHLEGSVAERGLRGEIDLIIKDGVATFKRERMRGTVRLHALLRQASPKDKSFDISGTRVELSSIDPPWSGVITLPRARMQFSQPVATDTAVRLTLQDTRPLVAILDAVNEIPGWMQRMMTISDISGGALVGAHDGKVYVNDLDITGKHLHALGEGSLGKTGREMLLYVRLHGFSIGIKRDQDGRDLKFIRPLQWFNAERAGRRAAQKTGPESGAEPGHRTEPARLHSRASR